MVVDKSQDRVRTMFGQIAPNYDRLNHLLSLQVDRYWRWRTTRMVPACGERPILDVCCGTGDLAFAYHRATRGAVPVVATDFCPQMLEVGEAKKQKAGINGQIRFIEADTLDLPFDDDSFQLVTVAFGLRNVSDTNRGLQEMVRVCEPGGRVAVLEFSMPSWGPLRSIYGWYFRHVLPRVGQWLARNDQDAYSYLPQSVGEFPSGRALADHMLSAGLEQVQVLPFTLGVVTLYVGSK